MTTTLALINTFIFLVLSGLHFYWMFGGKWGITHVLPTNERGERGFNPGAMGCFVVGMSLLLFAIYTASFGLHFSLHLPAGKEKWGLWGLALIFLLRGIGDGRYVGLFKKIKNTPFARMDSLLYAPLSLYLAFSTAWIASAV
jgi:hypothetical protein